MQKTRFPVSFIVLFKIACVNPELAPDGGEKIKSDAEPANEKPQIKILARKDSEYPSEEDFRRWRRKEPEPIRPECAEPPNLLLNGSFEQRPFSDCGWVAYDAKDWGIAAVQTCWDELRKGCIAFLETDVWGEPWAAQFYQHVLLDPGRYKLSFWARAEDRPRSVVVRAAGTGNFEPIGAGIEIDLTLRWQYSEFEFEVTDLEEGQVVSFDIGDSSHGLYLDDVMLIQCPIL